MPTGPIIHGRRRELRPLSSCLSGGSNDHLSSLEATLPYLPVTSHGKVTVQGEVYNSVFPQGLTALASSKAGLIKSMP